MQIVTPKDAELNAAEVMRSWGYLDAESPEHGADGGIDVRSSKALAQVKFRESKAGRPELQKLVGARQGEPGKALLFFDYKGYSAEAVVYANAAGIGLYVYDTSGAVRSVNQHGRRLMATTMITKLYTALTSPLGLTIILLSVGLLLAMLLLALTIHGM